MKKDNDKRTRKLSRRKLRQMIREEGGDSIDRPFIEETNREPLIREVAAHLEKARLKLDKRDAGYTAKMEMVLREIETSDPKKVS